MAVCHDPTGAHFSIFRGAEHPGAAQTGLRHGTFCWRELMTRNPDAAGRFYTRLFPWSAKASSAGQGYTEFQLGGQSIAGMMEIAKEMGDVSPHWGSYVQVDDVEATVNQAKKLEARILVPPTDVPNVGRFSTLSDPTGAVISVIQLG
jgi:predicted enzyme related to lactoylglutathione lyase